MLPCYVARCYACGHRGAVSTLIVLLACCLVQFAEEGDEWKWPETLEGTNTQAGEMGKARPRQTEDASKHEVRGSRKSKKTKRAEPMVEATKTATENANEKEGQSMHAKQTTEAIEMEAEEHEKEGKYEYVLSKRDVGKKIRVDCGKVC